RDAGHPGKRGWRFPAAVVSGWRIQTQKPVRVARPGRVPAALTRARNFGPLAVRGPLQLAPGHRGRPCADRPGTPHLQRARQSFRRRGFSPDGKRLGSGSADTREGIGEVEVWDAQSGKAILSLKGLTRISNVTFSPDGKRLAGGSESTVKVWD